MHYWRKKNALQTLGVPWHAAVGPPGPGGHYFFTSNALAGILIIGLKVTWMTTASCWYTILDNVFLLNGGSSQRLEY